MDKIGKNLLHTIYSFINYSTTFNVKLLQPDAKVPKKAGRGCAGYDVFSVDQLTIKPGCRQLISTGISTEITNDFYLRVAPRSGLSVKGIDIGAGVIDSSYRGELKVLVINNSQSDFEIIKGAKIAQIILERCSDADINVLDILSETERGYGGFGSTGQY